MTDAPADGGPTRRRWDWRDWYVWALIAGAAGFCLGPSLVGARTLISVNFLSNWLPWQAVETNVSVGHELCQSDTVDSVTPSVHYIVQQIFSGHLASWQNLQSGGGPMSSLPNEGLLDPLSLPYWILPSRWAPAFVVLLCWAAAVAGTYLFLRRLSVSRPASTLAGFVFATSGFMVMWTNWPQARTAALIPLFFWALDRVATRSRLGDVVIVAVVFASLLLSGFPQVTGFAVYMGAAYFVVRVWSVNRGSGLGLRAARRPVLLAVGGMALGGGLSAVQMLPFLDFYQTHGFAYRQALSQTGEPFGGLTTVVAPGISGLCVVQNDGGVGDHGLIPIELVAYIGAAALVLALAGLLFVVARRRWDQRGVKAFFVVATAVITALCFGPSWIRSVPNHLPVFDNSFIGRIRSVMGFGLAVLVGFGFDTVTARFRGAADRGRSRRMRISPVYAVVAAVALVTGVFALRDSHRQAFKGGYLGEWDHALKVPALLAGTAVVVIAVAVVVRTGRLAGVANQAAFVILPVLVIAQGTQFFHTVMPGDSVASFYPSTPDHQFLESHLGSDRFGSSELTLYSATAFYYGLRATTGHQFNDSSWNQLLTTVDKGVMVTPTFSDFDSQINDTDLGDQPILDQMGVKYFVLPPSELDGTIPPLPATSGSASSASGPVSCSLASGPIRGVRVQLAGPLSGSRSHTGPTIDVTVSDGTTTVSSGLYFLSPLSGGQTVNIPVAGEDLPLDSPLSVRLTAAGAVQPLVLAGTAGGGAACSPVVPRQDGLKLVFASPGAIIYQRLTALPRIRWDSNTIVDPSAAGQLASMKAGLPPATVLLSSPGPGGSGLPAAVQDLSDGDQISARVNASGSGYLVVADAMQVPGWSVTVDGHPARLVPADYAMVAVAVPAGNHDVTFTYTAPGQEAGAAITGLAVVVAIGLLWWDIPRRRRAER